MKSEAISAKLEKFKIKKNPGKFPKNSHPQNRQFIHQLSHKWECAMEVHWRHSNDDVQNPNDLNANIDTPCIAAIKINQNRRNDEENYATELKSEDFLRNFYDKKVESHSRCCRIQRPMGRRHNFAHTNLEKFNKKFCKAFLEI